MLILGIDSAGGGCSACVWRDGEIIAQAEERMERGQDRRLMPLIESVMQAAGVDYGALDRIAATRGPGSFTGIRIGLAAARGLGLAANKLVIGIDRLEIYRAHTQTPDKNLLVVIDSRRVELYARFYPTQGEAQEPCMMTESEIAVFAARENAVLAGDIMAERIDNEAVLCAALAASAGASDPAFLPRPLYIRPPDVTFPNAVQIRQADISLAAALAALHLESFGADGWSTEQVRNSLSLETTRGWVAFDGATAAGFILCHFLSEEAEILTLCVSPSKRRKKTGANLLRHAIDHAGAGGQKRFFLEVAADNLAAQNLYESFGFAIDGHRKGYYQRGAKAVDALLFSLPLESA